MSTQQVLTLIAAVAFLAIALIAARSRNPVGGSLALTGAAMFAYNTFELASTLGSPSPWDELEDTAAALSAIPTLDLFVRFVGLGRRLARLRHAATLYFTALAGLGLARLAAPALAGDPTWALLMLGGLLPSFGVVLVVLGRHAARARGEERGRTQLLLGALLVGVGGVVLDLTAMAGGNAPGAGAIGLPLAAILVAALVLRVRRLEDFGTLTVLNAFVGGIVAVLSVLVALSLGAGPLVTAFVIGVVVAAFFAALVPLAASLLEQRSRARYWTNLGRFSEQMAHDLRNPLAAIRGAAQFLEEERAQGRSLDPHFGFVEIILDRSDRLERVVHDYQRMGRVEPAWGQVDLNALVRTIADGHPPSDAGVDVGCDLAPDLPEIVADPDLLAFAVENLVRNAAESMPAGGKVEIRTERVAGEGRVRLIVGDEGSGMDVRDVDRAFDELFTTKAGGSGLGLSFVARVAEAHGGRATLSSELGRGTLASIELPLRPPRAPPQV